ncbi:MAG: hypothetical protein H0V31_07040 [Acidobacteria bacterium]|nr:hypothetical protein [Acidobacteriota bacterium]
MRKKLTKRDFLQILKKHNPNNLMIDTETGLEAVFTIAEVAEENGIEWILCGGMAMQIYGSPRLTKDADVIASQIVPHLEAERPLGFGGRRYRVRVGEKDVPVDWIVRNDDVRKLYQAALADAVFHQDIPIIAPEWLVILKYIAGRFKDQEDAVYLLRQKGLVNRKLIRANIKKVISEVGWGVFSAGLQHWYDIADGVIRTEREDYDPKSRIE